MMMSRDEMVNSTVTLDGKPAIVCGKQKDFPRVVNIKTGQGWEWSWEGVEYVILLRDGAFKS